MKAVVICAAAIIGLGAAPAQASVFTVGGPLSWACYKAAEALDARTSSLDNCTRALAEENLLASDRAATLVNRGILNRMLSRSKAAGADFDRAIAANPNLSEAWLNKAA